MSRSSSVERGRFRTDRVSLPQCPPARSARSGRFARWRAGVLIGVHVLMAAHVVHWAVTGHSLGRFVLSDSMRTLELGEINPGFVLFVGALAVTAVFGRLLCGWVCHMGAMQDLCAWLLRKVGFRPRLFRARLLEFVPLVLAGYMFVWPTLSREAFIPAINQPARAEFPGWSTAWTTHDLWEGMPSVWVAVPFLIISGFATVWFLGARGLCRYVCPYGGFLLPAEQLAPFRVTVDPARCDQCGLCTAACTAGVRVHDEVRLFGSVVDRNCVKSLDCVDACPPRALALRAAAPAVFRRGGQRDAKVRYDLSLAEECLCALVFIAVFLTTRGLYDVVPMLLAATLAVLAAHTSWKIVRLVREPNVRGFGALLKHLGRLTIPGRLFVGATAAAAVLLVQSAVVRAAIIAGSRHDERVTVAYHQALAGAAIEADQRAEAERALRWYALARPMWRGGVSLAVTPETIVRAAWLKLALGDRSGAVAELRGLLATGRAGENAVLGFADVLTVDGREREATEELTSYLALHQHAADVREVLAVRLARAGDVQGAERLFDARINARAADGRAWAGRGRLRLATGRAEEGLEDLRRAVELLPRLPEVAMQHAIALATTGRTDEAVAVLAAAAERIPAARARVTDLAREIRGHAEPAETR